MSTVIPRPNESIDSLLRRFKKVVDRSGVFQDLRKHEFYEKPSVRRKRKSAAARKRAMKRQRKTGEVKTSNQNFKWNKDRTAKIPLVNKSNTGNQHRPYNNSQRPNNGPRPYNNNQRPAGNRPDSPRSAGNRPDSRPPNNFKKKFDKPRPSNPSNQTPPKQGT